MSGFQQIDFVLVNGGLMQRLATCKPLPWAFMDCLNESDHRAVHASFLWPFTTSRKRRSTFEKRLALHRSIRIPHNAAHLDRFKAGIADAVAATNWRDTDPATAVQVIQAAACRVLQDTAPVQAAPKATWMSKSTWALLISINTLRRARESWKAG
eukprot:1896017-Amphidinium_carterae.1